MPGMMPFQLGVLISVILLWWFTIKMTSVGVKAMKGVESWVEEVTQKFVTGMIGTAAYGANGADRIRNESTMGQQIANQDAGAPMRNSLMPGLMTMGVMAMNTMGDGVDTNEEVAKEQQQKQEHRERQREAGEELATGAVLSVATENPEPIVNATANVTGKEFDEDTNGASSKVADMTTTVTKGSVPESSGEDFTKSVTGNKAYTEEIPNVQTVSGGKSATVAAAETQSAGIKGSIGGIEFDLTRTMTQAAAVTASQGYSRTVSGSSNGSSGGSGGGFVPIGDNSSSEVTDTRRIIHNVKEEHIQGTKTVSGNASGGINYDNPQGSVENLNVVDTRNIRHDVNENHNRGAISYHDSTGNALPDMTPNVENYAVTDTKNVRHNVKEKHTAGAGFKVNDNPDGSYL